MSTLSQKRIEGKKYWDDLENRLSTPQLKNIVEAFFKRDPVRLVASQLGLNKTQVARHFHTFQAFIANHRWAVAIQESKGRRRINEQDLQAYIDLIGRLRGGPVYPWFCFTFNGTNFRIDWLEKIGTDLNPKVKGRLLLPHGIVVTDVPRSAAAVRHRSVHLLLPKPHSQSVRKDKSANPLRFGNELLAYLQKFKGIREELIFECLLEFEWKAALERQWRKNPIGSESDYQFSALRDLIRAKILEF